MLLADLGAEVIKVESPRRRRHPHLEPPLRDGVSTYYLGINRNKRSVVLDLKDEDDVAAARELARRADVLVENFKPGGLARFGLDYDTRVAPTTPASSTPRSAASAPAEGAALPGYDLMVQAMSGLMSLTGDAGRPRRTAPASRCST